MPKAIDDYEALVDRSPIWLERTKGIGFLSAEDAIALGQSGPVLRGSGVDWDLRRAQPYLAYDQVDFRVPVYHEGDVWARYRVRMEEMRESVRIVDQALRRMPDGPWIADDRKVVLPPREELHTSMESLIHHFKIVTEGYRVPEGEVYVTVESPRGELGCYVVSDGGPKPWRVKFRAPVVRRARGDGDVHAERAHRGHDRDRRLARHGHGRGRPMSDLLRRGPGAQGAVPGLALGHAAGAAARAGAARLSLAGGAARVRRRARDDARVLRVGRFLLRHVPPRAVGRHWSRCARTSRARSSARSRCSSASSRSSAYAPARRPRTARSRCGRSSASAAAAGRRSSRSTTATARTSSPRTSPRSCRSCAMAS